MISWNKDINFETLVKEKSLAASAAGVQEVEQNEVNSLILW